MSDAILRPGARLGAYEILGSLGAGGMGEVYRAWDPRLERQVALKVLPVELGEDPERSKRFRREAKALAASSHPNIVTIHEVGEAEGIPFLAMELVDGETLDRFVPAGGMDLDRFFELAIPLADGLATAHERGIAHRDLKPGNVMVTTEGRVKILDFGLAKKLVEVAPGQKTDLPTATLEAMTRAGTFLGTAPYMSPEQIEGKSVDARSDVFSLGIVLHEMLTGGRPFVGENPPSLVSSILRDDPSPLRRIRPELPRHLGRIVGLCLEKRPTERFQSARDVRNQLEQLRRELETGSETPAPAVTAATAGTPRWKRRALVSSAVFLALLGGLASWWILGEGTTRESADERIAIAVLPLENLSGDPQQEYFADGMTEAMITGLARIDRLHVISRTSVVRYKDATKPAPEIARELGVRMLLEGTVLRAEDRVRITAQLIDAVEDRHLWAESYERDLRDILALQDDVSRAVAREVAVQLSPEEELRFSSSREVDPAAYEEYLKGEHFYSAFQNLEGALQHFQRAVEMDPSYAPAHVGISKTLSVLGYTHRREPLAVWKPARKAADRAVGLDEDLAEAWVARGRVQLVFDWDWAGAEASLDRALELNRNSFDTYETRSLLHMALGEHERDVAEMRRALALDPFSRYASSRLAWSLTQARRYQEAVEHLNEALKMHPGHPNLLLFLSESLAALGHREEAIETCAKADLYCYRTFAILGLEREALEALERRDRARPFRRPFSDALVYAQLGELDRALASLEEAYEMRSPDLITLAVVPLLDPLRDDPRYRELLGRLGLPQRKWAGPSSRGGEEASHLSKASPR